MRCSAEVVTGHVMQRLEVYAYISFQRGGGSSLGCHAGCLAGCHSSAAFVRLLILLCPPCGQLLISVHDSALGLRCFHSVLPQFSNELYQFSDG